MKKILVIGYNKNETKLYKLILKKFKNIKLINSKKRPILNFFRKFDLIISFGYRHIINKDIIKYIPQIFGLYSKETTELRTCFNSLENCKNWKCHKE